MMRKYRLFLFLSCIVAICFVTTEGKISGNQLVTITAPSNNDLIFEKSIHVLHKTSPYLDNANYRICFKAVSIFGSVVMDIHCWDKSSQIIFDIPLPGDYFLYGGIAQDNKIIAEMDRIRIARYNKDEIQESVIRVTSKSFDKKDNKLTSLAELNGKTTLEFTYLFENFGIPLQQLQTCIYIIRKNPSTDYLALSCISTSSLAIVLNNVEIGDYIVYLVLKDMSTNSMLFGTTTKFDLRVVKVADDPPSILLGSPIVEGSVHNLHSKTNIDIQYRVFHQIESAISFWKLCVSLSKYKCSSDDRDILKPNLVSYSGQFSQSRPCLNVSTPVFSHICVSTGQNMLHLSDLQEGFYHMKLALELNDQSSELKATSTEKNVIIDIRPQVEFVPSFDWQNLHAWHTIPNGLETRLPVGGVAAKQARIPDPWDLQLSMPSPCKYFLRLKLARHEHLSQICDAAAKQCHREPNCFLLQLKDNDESTDYNYLDLQRMSVEQSNIVQSKVSLLFNSECLGDNNN